MVALIAVAAALLVAVIAVAWWYQRRDRSPEPSLASLIDEAERLPPSPRRTVVRLRVELRESVDAAEAATLAAGSEPVDLGSTVRQLRTAATELDRDLATLSGRSDSAVAPVVPAVRTRVRDLQAVADRVVVLSREVIAGGSGTDLTTLHESVDHELRVLDARRQLDDG